MYMNFFLNLTYTNLSKITNKASNKWRYYNYICLLFLHQALLMFLLSFSYKIYPYILIMSEYVL